MDNILLVKSWNDVSISQFNELQNILNNDELETIDKNIQVAELFSIYSYDELEDMPILKLQKIFKQLSFLDEPLPKSKNITNTITIKGKTFYINKEIAKLTTSEYIDFLEFSKDADKNIHHILAIFVQPLVKTKTFFKTKLSGDNKHRLETAEFFLENMPVIFTKDLMVFFSLVLKRLLEFLMMSTKMGHKKLKAFQKLGIKSGDGLKQLILLQKRLEEVGKMYINSM